MRRGISDLNFYYINKLLQWIVSIEQIDYDKEQLDDDDECFLPALPQG